MNFAESLTAAALSLLLLIGSSVAGLAALTLRQYRRAAWCTAAAIAAAPIANAALASVAHQISNP